MVRHLHLSLHYITCTLHYVHDYVTLRYVHDVLRYVTVCDCVALHCIASHHITSHRITITLQILTPISWYFWWIPNVCVTEITLGLVSSHRNAWPPADVLDAKDVVHVILKEENLANVELWVTSMNDFTILLPKFVWYRCVIRRNMWTFQDVPLHWRGLATPIPNSAREFQSISSIQE